MGLTQKCKSKTANVDKNMCVLSLLAETDTDEPRGDSGEESRKSLFHVLREPSFIVNLSNDGICDIFCQNRN